MLLTAKRSIGDIFEMERTLPSSPGQRQPDARFFERLWWYDQLVFDTSG